VIGITGKAGAGKTYLADQLIQRANNQISLHQWNSKWAVKMHHKVLHFAEPVKEIAKTCFGWDGKKDERGRRLLQLIGTEVGRGYNPDIWVDKARNRLQRIVNEQMDCAAFYIEKDVETLYSQNSDGTEKAKVYIKHIPTGMMITSNNHSTRPLNLRDGMRELMKTLDIPKIEYWIVIDDLRFNNEAQMVKEEFAGIIIEKQGGNGDDVADHLSSHQSEAGIDSKWVDLNVGRIECPDTEIPIIIADMLSLNELPPLKGRGVSGEQNKK